MIATNFIESASRSPRIFLIEDDLGLASLVTDYLNKNGFDVVVNHTGHGVIDQLAAEHFDLIVLDIMLPSVSGMDLCRMIRSDYKTPLIIFTALDDDLDQMRGLELGADDYIIKPVLPRLLLSRIKALMRRVIYQNTSREVDLQANEVRQFQLGGLTIDTSSRNVAVQGKKLSLSSAEFDLLLILAQGAGSVIEREDMVNKLRGFEYNGLDRSIDRRVSRLRKKLKAASGDVDMIKTIRGKGYQLCPYDTAIEN